ncbi:MAG TPA: BatA domain-containing protein, partial [Anaeromyxobacteraceae bacterium]|nr:BatA domain-containing protein [Anaeromyxobacteraceae bacterium]
MNLSFANAALLWGLAAAAIPLAIHLFYRRRPKPMPFPAIDLVLRARRETERRLRLRRVLLFVARTALLAAAALAIARPVLQAPEAR